MAISPLAGKPAPKELLIDVAALEREYIERRPDMSDPNQRVSFGTSGHRGSPLRGTFTEAHILATTQAICDYRRGQGADGPLYMGKDTHALSGPAQRTALEVLAANGVETVIQRGDGLKLAVDPLGGAAVHYWGPINEIYGLHIQVVNPEVDPTFAFMTVDHDGKIRMDCSSAYAMARLVDLKDQYRVAFANDPDSDRHGIVTPSPLPLSPAAGERGRRDGGRLMTANHY